MIKIPFTKSRRFLQGGLSAVMAAVFIAVVVMLNLVVTMLSERYQLRLDLTPEQAFVLTDESKRYLDRLEQDVSIYILTPEHALTSAGDYFIQANEVIGQYAALSPRIKINYVDLTRDPGFQSRFPQYQLNAQTILLQCGERVSTISVYDLFNIESDYYYQSYYIVSSQAEQTMTSAIMALTMENPLTVAILTGFGEDNSEYFAELMGTNLYNVVTQNLLTEEIHPDAAAVVINAPMRDYSEAELSKLDAFLYNGGNYGRTLIYFADVVQMPMPNLEAFLADWGIAVDEGVVFQTDTTRLVTNSYFWSVVAYTEEEYAKTAMEQQLYTVMPESRPLRILWETQGNKTVTAPLVFDESACVQPLDADESWAPEQSWRWGPIPALLISRQAAYAGGEAVSSSVVVAGSGLMIDSSVMQSPYFGNAEYMLSILGGLAGRQEGVNIAPKTIGGAQLLISEFQIALLAALFVVVLPLAVLAAGSAVFFRRRHL